jgi:hypothetical protein
MESLAQSFQLNFSGKLNVPGTYLTSIGVFFQSKSEVLGASLSVVGLVNGLPDKSRIYGTCHLNNNQITVSDDSSAETKFTFLTPIMLSNDTPYAFIVSPDNGNPDYNIWVSEIGQKDKLTNNYISKQIYSGALFTSSNETTWSVIASQDIKFNLYRAKFKYSAARLVFRNEPMDYLNLMGYSRANTANPLRINDVVYAANTANTYQILSNTDIQPYGKIVALDELNQKVVVHKTNGLFSNTTFPILKFFRVTQEGNVAQLSNTNLIATANLSTIEDIKYHSMVPKFTLNEPSGSSMNMIYYATSNAIQGNAYDNFYESISNEQRYEFSDYERVVRSYSNEKSQGGYGANGSSTVIVNMYTNSLYSSPVVDMRTKSVNFITNQINNLYTNENTRYGNALNKYISLPVNMNITAEDFRVYVTGYRPPGTDFKIYGRFKNNHDNALLTDNPWTLLSIDPTMLQTYSSIKNKNDYYEYTYYMPVGNTVANQTIAYMNPNADLGNGTYANCLTYFSTTGTQQIGFDNFAIKIVMISTNQVLYPMIKTVSAIALMQ